MGQLKYNIRRRLNELSRQEHEEMIRKLLLAISPASRSTLYRWIGTKQQDHFQIPYTVQQKIAELFGCTVDELSAV
jgi:hypothetical protein